MQQEVRNYYKEKAQINVNDEYLERISEKDIDLMTKSLGILMITPFASFGLMYAAKKAKTDVSRADNFVYRMRTVTDKIMPTNINYARSAGDIQAPVPIVGKEESQKEAQALKDLYGAIKDDALLEK